MPVFLAFVAGVLLLQMQASLPSPFWAAVLAIPIFPLLFGCFRRHPYWRRTAFVLLAFALGFFWAAWRADIRLSEKLPADLSWRDIVVEGVVSGFPKSMKGVRVLIFMWNALLARAPLL